MYVTIEGIDTAGKSTQIEALRKIFQDAVFTKEPGGTDVGQSIRSMVLNGDLKSKLAEMFMFLADRSEHTQQVIVPNLDSLIISDRSCVSGVAYALVQNVCDMNTLIELNKIATDNQMPQHVFILQLPPQVLEYRLSQKEHDAIESRGTEYLLTIQDALIASANALGITTHVIDASQSIDTITLEIANLIKGAL